LAPAIYFAKTLEVRRSVRSAENLVSRIAEDIGQYGYVD